MNESRKKETNKRGVNQTRRRIKKKETKTRGTVKKKKKILE